MKQISCNDTLPRKHLYWNRNTYCSIFSLKSACASLVASGGLRCYISCRLLDRWFLWDRYFWAWGITGVSLLFSEKFCLLGHLSCPRVRLRGCLQKSSVSSEGKTILCENFVKSHVYLLLTRTISRAFFQGCSRAACALYHPLLMVVDLEHPYCSGMPAWFLSFFFLLGHPRRV